MILFIVNNLWIDIIYSVQSSPATTDSRPWWLVEYSDDGNAIGKNGKVKPQGGWMVNKQPIEPSLIFN